MSETRRSRLTVAALLVVAAVVFLLGINWGLPSSRVKAYLYGSEKPWSGERIYLLAGGWDGSRGIGADVDRTPLAQKDEPVVLNATDRQRAEIIRRYLLYSYQPDEMITFRALAQMHPVGEGGLDPKLYQYGGLWIYPVGILLKLGMWTHLIAAPPPGALPLVYYLDHPEAFGRFYVAARLYAVLWAIIGVWVIWWIARRLVRDELLAAAAGAAYIFLPVVMNGAHEAKPHLPGLVLMLLAIIAAIKYLEARETRSVWLWALCAGGLCGAAFGMVLSSLAIFLLLPVMIAWRVRGSIARSAALLGAAILVGILVYVVTNPYVPINLLRPESVGGRALRSNLGNSAGMYHVSAGGVLDAIRLLGLGTSPWLAVMGVAGAIALLIVARRRGSKITGSDRAGVAPPPLNPSTRPGRAGAATAAALVRRSPGAEIKLEPARPIVVASLFLVPAAAILVQFMLLAAGKPAEYARFGMLPDVALLLLAAWAGRVVAAGNVLRRQLIAAIVVIAVLPYGLAYCRAFIRDARPMTSRLRAAEELPVSGRVLVTSDPAPYNCPPVNLFSRDLVLWPTSTAERLRSFMREGDLLLYPVDVPVANSDAGARRLPSGEAPGSLDQFTTPITWADKTFALHIEN